MTPEPTPSCRRDLPRRGRHAAPGALIVDPGASKPVIQLMAYGPEGFTEQPIADPREIRRFLGAWPVVWVNVDGLGDAEVLLKIGELFGLHRLALEDVVSVPQRPRAGQFGEQCFLILRMVYLAGGLQAEQVSLFLGKGFVVTFQERPGDCLDGVRNRIRQGLGKVRQGGADYLAYALLEAVIDGYYPVMEDLGERLEALEERVIARPEAKAVGEVHRMRRELLALRRGVWPMREAVNAVLRDGSLLFGPETRLYLRDGYDHVTQIIDLLETYRELASGLVDVYMSSLSNRMNEVMKVLTMIATIFIPLSFVVGLYGMNFNTARSPLNMPELNWYWGYPLVLLVLACMAGGMLIYFRRKGWLSSSRSGRRWRWRAEDSARPS